MYKLLVKAMLLIALSLSVPAFAQRTPAAQIPVEEAAPAAPAAPDAPSAPGAATGVPAS